MPRLEAMGNKGVRLQVVKDSAILTAMAIGGVVILGVTYFLTIRQDGTVLLSLSSILGGFVGYAVAKRR
jgi:hypothetical protein